MALHSQSHVRHQLAPRCLVDYMKHFINYKRRKACVLECEKKIHTWLKIDRLENVEFATNKSTPSDSCSYIVYYKIRARPEELRESKTKGIRTSNDKTEKLSTSTQCRFMSSAWSAGRRNNYVAIVFGFASDWMKEWRAFSGPITERSKGNVR